MWKKFQLDTFYHAGETRAKQHFFRRKIDFEKNAKQY
jgi:hypothetical protein